MVWEVEVDTDEGRITRMRLLQAAVRAIMTGHGHARNIQATNRRR